MISTNSPREQRSPRSIARALTQRLEPTLRALLGEPSASTQHELRWGQRGSLSLCRSGPKAGYWYDHERGEGGDLLDLIRRERGVNLRDAMRIAEREFLGTAAVRSVHRAPRQPSAELDAAARRQKFAFRIWTECQPSIRDTLAERFFLEHRGLDVNSVDVSHALRWSPRISAIVALMTDAVSDEATGVHRTFLNSDGTKRDRKMLGRQGVIRLSPDDEVSTALGLTEGIEDAVAVLLSGWAPVWAATSCGAVARFPVLNGIEALTVFADADAPGLGAADTCCARWRSHAREACVAAPRRPA